MTRPLHALARLCLLGALAAGAQTPRTPPRRPAPRPKGGPAPRGPGIPQLGDAVPDALLKRAANTKPCDVGEGRMDPCAVLASGRDRVTVAWDSASKHVTFLFSTTLDTDDDLRLGDLLQIDPDSPITPFPVAGSPHRFVTVDWCDTDAELTGDATWCAVMVPVRPRSGKVVGFVQSLYLYLPEWDAAPMHRTGWTGAPDGLRR